MLKEKIIPHYEIDFYGSKIMMKDFTIYVDEDIFDEDYSPEQAHKIPRFEMARVAVVSAALQGELIQLEPDDLRNGVWEMYKKACEKELSFGDDSLCHEGVQRIFDHLKSTFQ